jgi:hypothetical protein
VALAGLVISFILKFLMQQTAAFTPFYYDVNSFAKSLLLASCLMQVVKHEDGCEYFNPKGAIP